MKPSSLQISFRFPDELDLMFFYLKKQEEHFNNIGQEMLPYEIQFGLTETVVEFAMTDKDWENPLGLA